MAQSAISLIQFLSTAMMLVFYLAALAYVVSRRTDRSSAKQLAATALIMMILLQLGSTAFTVWIAQTTSASNVAAWVSMFSFATSLVYMIAIGMLVAAIFVRRSPTEFDDSLGEERSPVSSENPYSPPGR